MPLHVADASHGLQLRVASTKLVEVPELALLQQVLAATVTGELVAHPAGEETSQAKENKKKTKKRRRRGSAWEQHAARGLRRSSGHLRSTADGDAAHSVSESVGEQAGNVIVHDLHLAALELSHLEQADLVLLGVLAQDKYQRQSTSKGEKSQRSVTLFMFFFFTILTGLKDSR